MIADYPSDEAGECEKGMNHDVEMEHYLKGAATTTTIAGEGEHMTGLAATEFSMGAQKRGMTKLKSLVD